MALKSTAVEKFMSHFLYLFNSLETSLSWNKFDRNKILVSLRCLVIIEYYSLVYLTSSAAAKSLQSCPTLCDPTDGSPPGSPVPGILQARTLEWVAISFSDAWKWKGKVKSLSCVQLLVTPWTTAYQAPPSMGFSRREYWSGVPLPSPNLFWVISNLEMDEGCKYF